MGQSRGAQSGEADRHAVWLEAHGLEPKMSPFDPMAILDEIQRLVPGYEVSRMNLLAGNDQHTTLVGTADREQCSDPKLIVPAQRQSVQFRHAGALLADAELGDGEPSPAAGGS